MEGLPSYHYSPQGTPTIRLWHILRPVTRKTPDEWKATGHHTAGYILPMVDEVPEAVSFDQANVVQRGMRLLAGTRPMAWLFARVLHHLDGPVMRRSGGRHSVSAALTGLPIIELTTVGARSGEPRTLPLVGVPDGDRLVLVASNYGKKQNPAWYYNLKANPRCRTTFRGQRHDMDAYEAEGEERRRLWELDVSVYPPRNHYAQRAGNRRIPVMVLQPAPVPTR
jgi:deazaflavin-dependent oxidoreductase (nitroreductase family)